jgi:hypothetical protein
MPPKAITRPVPYLSASEPATGCARPHIRLCSATARPKAQGSTPFSICMGSSSRPKVCRVPMASEAVKAAEIRATQRALRVSGFMGSACQRRSCRHNCA